jgi:ParB family transcriptional regulator, chromosome partitioning protein
MPRNALGRGLGALIREPEIQQPPQQQPVPATTSGSGAAAVAPAMIPAAQQPTATSTPTTAVPTPAPTPSPNDGFLQIDIDLIDPSPYQPRTRFREEALEELARSIVSSGIVQPLVVRRVNARYQLIAGERRWRAAQRASMQRVPVVVRDVSEEMALEMTLVENLQREDLNPIEQARAFQRLTEEFSLTQEQVADRTGKDRATIANAVRLLKLEGPIQDLLEEGRLSAGHGRALLAIAGSQERLELSRRIARGGMTVRQVERLATKAGKPRTARTPFQLDANMKAAVEELQRVYGTRVLVHPKSAARSGQLIFEYYNDSDLARLYDQLMAK